MHRLATSCVDRKDVGFIRKCHIQHVLFIVISLSFILLVSGCDILNPENTEFYFTSFENASDAEGWTGIGVEMFVEDPAPNSGDRSLLIGGGCIQPTAKVTLPEIRVGGFYTISCWGKIDPDFHGGSVILALSHNEEESFQIELRIDRQGWYFYSSEESIYCPASESLQIQIRVGGIVYDCMKLDGLKIEKSG